MKVSKTQVKENREKIVEKATQLFRNKGYDGVGIAELMSSAGFTHGGFYKHFSSKTDLVSITVKHGLEQVLKRIEGLNLAQFIQLYVSRTHRDNRDLGCTLTALSCDAARQPDEVKVEFEEGIEQLIQFIMNERAKQVSLEAPELRKQAINILAQSVGAIALSRACPDQSNLSDEILESCKESLLKLAD
ncbi:TetR/AcrR family transcriptional regulator [Acinetobacter pittii]|uniref:TetR/AcrR family transcriptional regulator n=1 Tax=Acinetobacter pittii TaxID=48296 RepID=UPI001952612A|nr:TetR/AcrR family transcriptional regulator [Acinetobacter pittii]QRQ13195.1 TetR/AcrR family transcriptional regulator [Acinetobacter pittii]